MPTKIDEVAELSADDFQNKVLPAGKPLVIRGLVNNWPIVHAGKAGAEAFCDYLKRFDKGYEVNTVYGPPSIKGRIFYNKDLSGLNCRLGQAKLAGSLDYLLEHANDDPAPTLALQSIIIPQFLPGLETENHLALLPSTIEPRIWLGSRGVVAAHYDSSENIACCIAGKRRFILFPPNQIENLYVGPIEMTPAGATISMVDIDNPDYEQYPKFRQAEAAALHATLEPGDAIYIPYMWWHNVRSLESVNALVNYWWGHADEDHGEPRNALLHAMMSIRSLPIHHRNAWQAMFDYYVFEKSGKTGEHLPQERRGILEDMKPESLKKLRTALSNTLKRR